MFEKLFKINQQGSSVKREVIAGITTFVTMVYIVFVNPAMLEVYDEIPNDLLEYVEDVILNRRPDATERLLDLFTEHL